MLGKNPLIIFIFLLFGLFGWGIANSEDSDNDEKMATHSGGCTYWGDYNPKEIRKYMKIPEEIRVKLENHLNNRLGEKFFEGLEFESGEFINLRKLYKKDPDAYEYEWEVYSYELHFGFSAPEKGIRFFIATIALDENGDVVEEIDLPNISKAPHKENIISLRKAHEIAVREHFPPEMGIEIDYDLEVDSLVWIASFQVVKTISGATNRNIKIDAHSGEIIEFFETVFDH
jgi:hypothetical protein